MKKIVVILIILFGQASYSQMIEDGLNLSIPNGFYSARAGALGVSYHGIADDFSAISFNPAGLSLIDKGEISFGFDLNLNATQTQYLGNTNDLSSSNAYLTNFGIVAPFKTKYGNASFAVGYYLESNFENSMEFAGFNEQSSYIDFEALQAFNNGWGINENFATYLWLADDYYETPLKNNLYQEAFVNEEGGLKNFSGAFSFELSENLSIGFSLTGKWGTYKYSREYSETDTKNLYENFDSETTSDRKLRFYDIDFDQLNVNEKIVQDISGIAGSIGIQTKLANFLRLGMSIKLPTFYDINEDFDQIATAYFDNGDIRDTAYLFTNAYSFSSPWVFSAGLSMNLVGVVVTSGIEYTDLSQMEFSSDYNLESLNSDIIKKINGLIKVGAGIEWQMPFLPMDLRASIELTNSPYIDSFDGEDRINIGFGAGFYLLKNMRFDLMGRYSKYKKLWNVYGNSPDTELYFTREPLDIALQLSYRY